MNNQDLISILKGISNAKRTYRDAAADAVVNNPQLIPLLVKKVSDIQDPLHVKAAWVLELICLQDVSLLNKSIETFIRGMSALRNESVLRPVSKTCSLWCRYYLSENPAGVQLREKDIERIVTANFDWLIENHKVATQVFAMDTLHLWGNRIGWIHPELRSILEKNFDSGSSGYKVRARKLLKILPDNDG